MRFAQWILMAAMATTVALTGFGVEAAQAGGLRTVYVHHHGAPNPGGAGTCGAPNYATITEALNDISTIHIVVCPGTYTEQLEVVRSMSIEGQPGAVIQAPQTIAGAGMIVDFTGPQHSVIDGLTIQATGTTDPHLYAGIGVRNGATVQITNNHITDIAANAPGYSYGDGIAVFGGQAAITGNTIERYWKDGIEANAGGIAGAVNASITKNTVKGQTVADQSHGQIGINLRESVTGSITENTVTGNQTKFDDSGFGILVDDTVGVRVQNNTVSGNQVGLEVSESNQATVSGNTATANTGNGIQLHKTFDSTVSGNTATNNSGSGIVLTGNKYDPTFNVAVRSNTISGNGVDGVFIDQLMVTNKVQLNTITSSGHFDTEDANGKPFKNSFNANNCTTSNPAGICS